MSNVILNVLKIFKGWRRLLDNKTLTKKKKTIDIPFIILYVVHFILCLTFAFILSQVIRPENSDNWTLQIKFPQLRDTGIYECQVNTEPKMSMAFRLNVVGEYRKYLIENSFHS